MSLPNPRGLFGAPRSRVRFFIIAAIAFGVFLAFGADACNSAPPAPSQQAKDQQNNNDASSRLHKAYPYPQLTNSNELANQTKRYHDLNDDPNRVSYVYLMSLDGKIIAEYQLKGKVSSTDSLYSAPASIACNGVTGTGGQQTTCPTVPASQPDGSYGANEPGIYFFINDADQTMVEWNGTYLWSLNRLHLVQAPNIVVVPNGH